jgi:hypothetical protein
MTLEQSKVTQCSMNESSFIDANGESNAKHSIRKDKPIIKLNLLKFLRDHHRICWLEIYMKMIAAV